MNLWLHLLRDQTRAQQVLLGAIKMVCIQFSFQKPDRCLVKTESAVHSKCILSIVAVLLHTKYELPFC